MDRSTLTDLALTLDPSNLKALRHRGMARRSLPARRAEARRDLERYLAAHPEDAKAARALASVSRGAVASSAAESSAAESAASEPTGLPQHKVPYAVERIGEGEIFALHRISFAVPRAQLDKLQGGSATVQVRGGSFALAADPEAGAVETVVESPDPTPVADAIAERIYLRINSDVAPPGMEVCVVS